jgi:hypothetical protein
MPVLTLAREWVDPAGTRHPEGAVLEVDDITATRLAGYGYVVATDPVPYTGDLWPGLEAGSSLWPRAVDDPDR